MIIEDPVEEGSQLSDITEVAANGIRRVECTVFVPDDLYETEDEEERAKERYSYARYVAREQLPDYCIPANWYLVWDKFDEVRVARESAVVK